MADQPKKKLLTIAIPTYNRARYLDLCLSQLSKQIIGHEDAVEVIVSNNGSSDDTEKVVSKYISGGCPIKYASFPKNMGFDHNVVQCYKLAAAKYILCFADDDTFLEGAIEDLLKHLGANEYGVTHLTAYSYDGELSLKAGTPLARSCSVYKDRKKFVQRVNYFLAFMSGNVVNKSLVGDDISPDKFMDSQIAHLGWVLAALFKAKENAYVEGPVFAVKKGNARGYQLCEVFGPNINKIFDHFRMRGIDGAYFKIIDRHLLFSFFPHWIYKQRRGQTSLGKEDYYGILFPVYRGYISFWLFTVPIIKLPMFLATFWFFAVKVLVKAGGVFSYFQRRA